MRKTLFGFLALVLLCVFATPAFGGTASANIAVGATVLNVCTITATPLAFGNYDPTVSTANDNTATVVVACTLGASANVTLGQGSHAANGSTDAAPLRQMEGTTDTTQRLRYDLYQNSGRSTVWGNTSATGENYTGVGPLNTTTLTVYGRLPINQNAKADVYSDIVVATITY